MAGSMKAHGIDLYAPGGLDALFAFRRSQFGDAVMMSDGPGGDGGTGGDPAGAPPADPGTPPAPAAPPADPPADPAGTPPAPEWDGKVESLPAPVQKMIRDLRTEAGDERVATKTLDAIQKALNPDAPEAKVDPAELTATLTTAQQEARQARQESAVLRSAVKLGADADALLDSRGFLAKLGETDPTDAAAITALVDAAVKENPKFLVARAAGRNAADFTGGSGEGRSTKPVPLHEAVSGHYGRG